jgi:hypothetical protein
MKIRYFLVILLLAGCSQDERPESILFSSFKEIESPASAHSGQPYLFSEGDGKAYLSWIEPGSEKKHAFRFAKFEGDRWNQPNTIIEGDEFFVNWADVPSIFRSEDRILAAHWLESSGDWVFAYDIKISLSSDNGVNWSEPFSPHRDGTKTEHGFASFFNHPSGGIGFVWLDGREAVSAGAADSEGHGHGGDWNMHLRSRIIQSDNQLAEEVLLHDRVCECCPTAVTGTNGGVVIAYRNRSDEEIRDIYLVRYSGGLWSEPYPVHNDGWNIAGCPVNGPALASAGDRVVAAWYTEADDEARVNIVFSRDGGRTFASPYRIDDGVPLGRVAVELLDDRSALVMWMELLESNAGVMVRRVYPDGSISPAEKIADVSDSRSSGYPRMARLDKRILFSWVETSTASGEGNRVRTAIGELRED